jgi:hypothetical protein
MLAIAEQAAPAGDADAWAARALACAQQRGLGAGLMPLLAARLLALPGGATSVADLRRLAVDLAGARIGRPAAAAVLLKTDEQARAAFNHPQHWSRTPQGLLLPIGPLQGASADAWGGLTKKFGDALAQRMFDAQVRGGALAVIEAMDQAGSQMPPTDDDLAALHFVAFSDGSFGLDRADRPHDEEHTFTGAGVSWVEETYNNYAISATSGLKTPIDALRPLHQQPELVAEVRSRSRQRPTDHDFWLHLHVAVDASEMDGPPAEAAAQTERELQIDGYLAHLNAVQRNQLRSMIYDAAAKAPRPMAAGGGDAQPTLEGIASRFARSNQSGRDRDQFECDLATWSARATDLLVGAAQGNRLPDDALLQSAARLFAFKLCRARYPGGDLRVHYLPVLREVQTALDLLL